jgi:hypothetical protein
VPSSHFLMFSVSWNLLKAWKEPVVIPEPIQGNTVGVSFQ